MQCTHDTADASQFLGCHLGSLVEQHDVTELNLLNHQVLDILFVDVRTGEQCTTLKLVAHTQGIYHRDYAVQTGIAVLCQFRIHRGDRADGLCDRTRFADAAGLDDDIVEALHLDNVLQLLDEVHFQCAADASVLQSHQRVVLLVDDATLLNQRCVNVHLTDIIHDNGKLDTFLVGKDTIQ